MSTQKKWKRKDYIDLIDMRKKGKKLNPNSSKFKNYMKYSGMLSTISEIKNKKLKKELIKNMPKGAVSGISEVVDGLINKDIPIDPKTKKILKRHEKVIIDIQKAKKNKNKIKNYLEQKGGFLSALLPLASRAIAPLAGQILSPIIGDIFGKVIRG